MDDAPVPVPEEGLAGARCHRLPPGVAGVLVPEAAVRARVEALADALASRLPKDPPAVAMTVLFGGAFFAARLLAALARRRRFLEPRFCRAESYREGTRPGRLELWLPEVRGRRVVLLDDVLDTGRTLRVLAGAYQAKGNEVSTVVLAVKRTGRACMAPDLAGFSLPDRFLVGWGMDWAGRFRDLPYIAWVEPGKGPETGTP